MPQPEWHLPKEGRFTPRERNLSPHMRRLPQGNRFFAVNEIGLEFRPLGWNEALEAISESARQGMVFDQEEAFGLEYWPTDSGQTGPIQRVGFGVKNSDGKIITLFWGTAISQSIAGIGPDQVCLVILSRRTVEVKIATMAWLTKRGFSVLK